VVNGASDREAEIRARIRAHWEASESGDVDLEHAIYAADAILDYPQSGERFTGRSRIQAQRGGHPADRHFTIRRILGSGALWVSECVITYDGVPTYSLSIMGSPTVSLRTRPSTSPTPSRRLPGALRWLRRFRTATNKPIRPSGRRGRLQKRLEAPTRCRSTQRHSAGPCRPVSSGEQADALARACAKRVRVP
jgi:hypothetical protein